MDGEIQAITNNIGKVLRNELNPAAIPINIPTSVIALISSGFNFDMLSTGCSTKPSAECSPVIRQYFINQGSKITSMVENGHE